MERESERPMTIGEFAYRRYNEKWFDEVTGGVDQAGVREYRAKVSALGAENQRIGDAMDGLDKQAVEQIGEDYLAFDDNLLRLKNLGEQLESLVKQSEQIVRTSDEEYIRDMKELKAQHDALSVQFNEVSERVNGVVNHPLVQEMSQYNDLYKKNIDKFNDISKDDRYRIARDYMRAIDMRQKYVDASYRDDGVMSNILGSTRDIMLKGTTRFFAGLSDLTDMVEKAVGDEEQGPGDYIQDFFGGVAEDAKAMFPAPTNLSRGIRTTTAMYDRDGEMLQVDFDKDGNIAVIRDKEGYVVKNDLTPSEIEEVNKLEKEKSWNVKSIPYQAGETIVDMVGMVAGAKGLGALGRGGRAVSALENVGFVATSAGMMSGDLYQEGIKAGLSEEEAAQYALAVGVTIGASNIMLGLGAEAQLLNKGIVSKVASPNFGGGLKGAIAEKSFNVLKSASGEMLEEIGIEKLETMGIQHVFNTMAGGQFEMNQFEDADAVVSEAVVAFVVGGMVAKGKDKDDESKVTDNMTKEMQIEAVNNIPEVVEQIRELEGDEVAAKVEEELTELKQSIDSVPEEQKSDIGVLDKVSEKKKVEEEIAELKKEKSGLDSSFHEPIDEKLERAEGKRNELEQSIRERKKEPSPTFISGEFEVNEETFEVTSRLGNEVTPYQKRKVLKEYKEARVDKIATQGEIVDLSTVAEENISETVLNSDNPSQIAEAYLGEPDQSTPTDSNQAIQSFLSLNSFSEDLMGQFIGNKTRSERKMMGSYTKSGKPEQNDLGLFMEELNGYLDSIGMPRATEEDVRTAMELNPTNKKVKFESGPNKTKKALADKFKELTGVTLDNEYAERIVDRSKTLREEAEIASQDPTPPSRPIGQEGTGEKVRRGTQEGILERGKNLGEAQGAIKKLSDQTPDFYNRLNLKEYGQQIAEEIERDGGPMSPATLASIEPRNVKSPVKAQAKRVVVLQMLGDKIAEAWKSGDTAASDVISSTIDRVERDMAESATEAGQQSAVLALWYNTPEGRIAQLVHKVRKARQNQLETMTSNGEPVGAVVDKIVKEVAKQLGIPASQVNLQNKSAATKKRQKAQKEVEDAFRAIGRDIRRKAGAAPSVKIELLVDAFKAIRKLYSASMEEAKIKFVERLDKMGLNGKQSLERLESERPSLFSEEQEGITVNEFLQGADVDKKELRKRVEQIVKQNAPKKKVKQITDTLTEAITLGGLDEDAMRSAVEEKFGIPNITQEDAKLLNEMVQGAKELPEGRLRNERFQRIMDYVTSNFTGEDAVDVTLALWHSFVLSGPRTWFSVLWGNLGTSLGLLYRIPTQGGLQGAKAMMSALPFIWKEMGVTMRTGTSYKSMDKIIKSGTMERIAKRKLSDEFKTGLWMIDAFLGQAWALSGKDRATMLSRGFKVGNKRIGFKDVGRIMNALDAISFHANAAFLMGRDAYRIAISEGLSGKEAEKRANEIIAGNREAREKFIEQARQELEGKDVNEWEIMYRAKEIGEQKLEQLSPGSVEKAESHGRRMSLQGPARGFWGALAKKIGSLADIVDRDKEGLSRGERWAGDFLTFYIKSLVPFLNTAAHMTNLAMDYVPVGGLVQKGLDALPLRGVEKGEFWSDSEERRIFAMKQMVGTALFFSLLGMATDDEDDSFDITANGPDSFSKKSDFYSHGMKPYSIRIGDKVINYRDWPIAGALAMLGGMADKAKYNDPEMEDGDLIHMYSALMGYFSNASMLQTFGQISKAANEKDPSGLAAIATRPILGFTNPGIFRHAERLFLPELRDKKSSPYGKLAGQMASNVPLGGFMDLDFKYNSLGEKINPGKDMSWLTKGLGMDKYISSAKPYNEIFEVMADKGVFFPAIGQGTKLAGTKMEYHEYAKYALAVGRARRRLLPPPERLENMSKEEIESMLSTRRQGSIELAARDIAEMIILKNRENVRSLDIEKVDEEIFEALREILGR